MEYNTKRNAKFKHQRLQRLFKHQNYLQQKLQIKIKNY